MKATMAFRTFPPALAALAASAMLLSCGAPRVAVGPDVGPHERELIGESVIFLDRASSRRLEVAAVNTYRDVNDRLHVQARLRNRQPSDYGFVYYFEWLGDDGWTVPKGTGAWNPSVIYGHSFRELTAVAPSPEVERFRLQIKQK